MVANEGAGKNPAAKEIISRPTGEQYEARKKKKKTMVAEKMTAIGVLHS